MQAICGAAYDGGACEGDPFLLRALATPANAGMMCRAKRPNVRNASVSVTPPKVTCNDGSCSPNNSRCGSSMAEAPSPPKSVRVHLHCLAAPPLLPRRLWR
jgi:hypothetical protein